MTENYNNNKRGRDVATRSSGGSSIETIVRENNKDKKINALE